MQRPSLVFLAVVAPYLTACVTTTFPDIVQTRASSDFPCDSKEIVVTGVGGHSYQATGCNKQAVYDCARAVCIPEQQHDVAPPPPLSREEALAACAAADDYDKRVAAATGPAKEQLERIAWHKHKDCASAPPQPQP